MTESNQEILQRISKQGKSLFLENAKYRIENKAWLKMSSKVAGRVLSGMEDLSMTKEVLSEKTGISLKKIELICKGNENLTLKEISLLSDALKVDLITFPFYKDMLPIKSVIAIKNRPD